MASDKGAQKTRRQLRAEAGEELLQSYDNMAAMDGSRKQFCRECGLPRDVEFAKTHTCAGCGALGTQAVSPQFDELGDRVPDEVIAARKAEAIGRLRAGREAKKAGAAPVEAEVEDKWELEITDGGEFVTRSTVKVATRTSARQPNTQSLPRPARVEAADTQAAFLMMW